jgi:hypothetical protein
VLFFHRTRFAQEILRNGFVDGTDRYLTVQDWSGVWLSDCPLEASEGAIGTVVLVVEAPESLMAGYEWRQPEQQYREYCAPAEVVNRYPIRKATKEEIEGAERQLDLRRLTILRETGALSEEEFELLTAARLL